MRRLLFLIPVLALSLLACKSPCRQLSEKLCECATTSTARDSCRTVVGQEESRVQPTTAQQDTCQALLDADQCSCHNIETAEGKRACGLAR